MVYKIWGILEGPTSLEELIEDDGAPEGAKYFMICKVEYEGKLEEDTFWFENFDDAYGWVNHFKQSVEPLVLDMSSGHEYN